MSPANASFERIAFVASPIAEAQEALERLAARYGNAPPARRLSRSAATASCRPARF
jgi:hypothetical protein